MDEIPFEEQRVISELVEFWQTDCEPSELPTHITELRPWKGTKFFRQVYNDLCMYPRSKYTTFSLAKFKQYLDNVYLRMYRECLEIKAQEEKIVAAEREARAKAEREARDTAEREAREKAKAAREAREKANQAKARADFDALGKEMENVTHREDLVELGRKRAGLALHTGVSYVYKNHCWNCKKDISSEVNARCPDCRFYICSSCSSCMCGFDRYETSPF